MSASFTKSRQRVIGIVLLVFGALLAGATSGAKTREADDDVKLVRTEKLANAPGQTLTAVTVNYAPGGKSRGHHHAGSVFAYVLSGAIRSENSATGPVKVYKAGESFFEPPGSKHLVSENASATEPASLLAVFIADDGAQLTTFDSARSALPADNDRAKAGVRARSSGSYLKAIQCDSDAVYHSALRARATIPRLDLMRTGD
jgi:quercetin dioxygenase-like cupin family protein